MKRIAMVLCLSAFLAGCQSTEQAGLKKESAVEGFEPEEHIIAELKQTSEDTAIRDEAYEKVLQNETLTGGYLGEVTPELEEEFGVQSIESGAVQKTITDVYGSISGVGVFFLSNPADAKDTPGVWVGIKKQDERFDQFISALQKQVDEGRILAKYIHLFQSDFTEQENNDLLTKAASALDRAARSHRTPDLVHYGVSVDVRTGIIEVSHDFLTEEEVVRSAISQDKSKGSFAAIRSVKFDKASDQWTVTFVNSMASESDVIERIVDDQR